MDDPDGWHPQCYSMTFSVLSHDEAGGALQLAVCVTCSMYDLHVHVHVCMYSCVRTYSILSLSVIYWLSHLGKFIVELV